MNDQTEEARGERQEDQNLQLINAANNGGQPGANGSELLLVETVNMVNMDIFCD